MIADIRYQLIFFRSATTPEPSCATKNFVLGIQQSIVSPGLKKDLLNIMIEVCCYLLHFVFAVMPSLKSLFVRQLYSNKQRHPTELVNLLDKLISVHLATKICWARAKLTRLRILRHRVLTKHMLSFDLL